MDKALRKRRIIKETQVLKRSNSRSIKRRKLLSHKYILYAAWWYAGTIGGRNDRSWSDSMMPRWNLRVDHHLFSPSHVGNFTYLVNSSELRTPECSFTRLLQCWMFFVCTKCPFPAPERSGRKALVMDGIRAIVRAPSGSLTYE